MKPQNQQQQAQAPLNRQQLEKLFQIGLREMVHSPLWQSWTPSQRAHAVEQHVYRLSAIPHYLRMIGYDYVPTQAQNAPDQNVANQKTTIKPEEESPKGPQDEFLGMTPIEIADVLVKAGKVKDETSLGAGLQIFNSSARRPHQYKGS